jgi:hypothetical protein
MTDDVTVIHNAETWHANIEAGLMTIRFEGPDGG